MGTLIIKNNASVDYEYDVDQRIKENAVSNEAYTVVETNKTSCFCTAVCEYMNALTCEQEMICELLELESGKIRHVLDCKYVDTCKLIQVNDSVARAIKEIAQLQLSMAESLRVVKEMAKICELPN